MVEKIAVLDFETFAIKARPDYPPKPVGLAYFLPQPGKPVGLKDYLPCRSPSERQKVKGIIKDLARDGYRFLMHNASFDLDVMETHLGVAWPGTHHDSLLLAYLVEPRAPTFSLKPTAERLLGIPKERDKLREWILEHVEGATAKTWGAYISEAPFELVRPYAIADVDLSYKLFLHYQKILRKDSQLQRAYERELKVTRVLVKMERRGIPVRVPELEHDLKQWKQCKHQLEQELFVHLKVPKAQRNEEFAWSGKNFAKLVVDSGLTDGVMPMTDKGNPSTSADNLGPLLPKKIAIKLEVRAQLQTCISTFAEAWLAQARNGGRFYARYNQVRQDYHGGGGMVGTTTGRVSMTPNLQNVIRSDKDPRVPKLRGYLGPPKGWWWLKRDYSQQEFRIFAHYEEGELLDRYRQDPKMDAHVVTGLILKERAGVDLSRRTMKDINFGVIYGMGKKKMAVKLGLEPKIAYQTMAAYHKSLPGIRVLQDNLKELAENHEPIYTWGGRRYYCEEPKVITEGYRKGDLQTFEYKLLNLLVQGSAADATKEAMIRYDATGWNEDDKGPLLLQVHDELDALARAGVRKDAMKVLRECMESIELDVPLLSDGSASNVSWDQVEDVTW